MSRAVASDPDVDFVPDQSPLAMHSSAFEDVQLRVTDSPDVTLESDAVRLRVGLFPEGCCTDTFAESEAEPPAPVHVIVKLEFELRGPTVSAPVVAFAPDQSPLAEQVSALLLDQLKRTDSPATIAEEPALSDTLGAAGGSFGSLGGGLVPGSFGGGFPPSSREADPPPEHADRNATQRTRSAVFKRVPS